MSPRYRAFFRRAVQTGGWCVLVLAGWGILAAPLGLYCSFIERLTHVRLYWIAALCLCGLGWAWTRQWKKMLAALLLAGWASVAVIRYYQPVPAGAAVGEAVLTVASWNVHASNRERDRALAWLRTVEADVLLLTEVNPGWAAASKAGTARWPHQICETRNGAAGIWLLSRWPLSGVEPAGIAADEPRPWIACTVECPKGRVRVVGMHPRTPRGGHRFTERNGQLDLAASLAASAPGPVVLLGDWNCTPFSPWFGRMLQRGNLKDAAMGRGLTPTWSSGLWWLPIDHILTGGGLQVMDWQVNADRLGSDHFPIRASLALPAP